MPNMRPLTILVAGSIASPSASTELRVVGTYDDNSVSEVVNLDSQRFSALSKAVLDLRGYIEGGYPRLQESDLQQLGATLFDLIIQGNIRRLFDLATGQVGRRGVLPIVTALEDFEFASWPWEYIFDSGQGIYVSRESHPLSRNILALPGKIAKPQNQQGQMRILFINAVAPDDSNATPVEEKRWIQQVFRRAVKTKALGSNSIELRIVDGSTPQKLEDELNARQYDVLHFFGHGGFDHGRKQGYVVLKRTKTKMETRIYADQFGQLIAPHQIRLVFLNGCETARTDQAEDPARSSLAAALLQRGIPAVIANQYSMADVSAHYLAAAIYSALAAGKTVTEAVASGRRAMMFANESQYFDWGIPVLYAIKPNLILFRPQTLKSRR